MSTDAQDLCPIDETKYTPCSMFLINPNINDSYKCTVWDMLIKCMTKHSQKN